MTNTELAQIVPQLCTYQPNKQPPLTLEQFLAFEAALECSLPDDIKQLYLEHDGHEPQAYHSMFLMPSGDALEVYEAIKRREDWWFIYPNLTDNIRYLWHDEDGNYAGLYVAGPLAGKIVFNNHEDPSPTPVFRSVITFYRATLKMVHTGTWGWEKMTTDYPVINQITPADAAADLAIASTCLENWKETRDIDERIGWAPCVTALMPPEETGQLLTYLDAIGFDRSKIIDIVVKRRFEPETKDLTNRLLQELSAKQSEVFDLLVTLAGDNAEDIIQNFVSEIARSNRARATLAFWKLGYKIRKTGEDYEYLPPNETNWRKLG